MKILTVKQAKQRHMEPITVSMKPTDPCLYQVAKDMKNITNTTWGFVHEGLNRVAVWRVPAPGTIETVGPERYRK